MVKAKVKRQWQMGQKNLKQKTMEKMHTSKHPPRRERRAKTATNKSQRAKRKIKKAPKQKMIKENARIRRKKLKKRS